MFRVTRFSSLVTGHCGIFLFSRKREKKKKKTTDESFVQDIRQPFPLSICARLWNLNYIYK